MLDRYAHPGCGLSHASLACMRTQPNPGCRLTNAALAGTTLLSRSKRFESSVDKNVAILALLLSPARSDIEHQSQPSASAQGNHPHALLSGFPARIAKDRNHRHRGSVPRVRHATIRSIRINHGAHDSTLRCTRGRLLTISAGIQN